MNIKEELRQWVEYIVNEQTDNEVEAEEKKKMFKKKLKRILILLGTLAVTSSAIFIAYKLIRRATGQPPPRKKYMDKQINKLKQHTKQIEVKVKKIPKGKSVKNMDRVLEKSDDAIGLLAQITKNANEIRGRKGSMEELEMSTEEMGLDLENCLDEIDGMLY